MKTFIALPEAEKINAEPIALPEAPEIPEKKKSSGIEGWIFLVLIAAMLAGLAFEIKYVFGFSLSALLILGSLSRSLSKRTPAGSRPVRPVERVPMFIAGLAAAAFTILAHAKGRTAELISSWLVVGILLLLPLVVLYSLVTGAVRELTVLKKRRKRCIEPVSVEFKGLTLRGTGLPPGIDPMYGGNREYEYWYGGEGYRILLPAEGKKTAVMTEVTVDPEVPEHFYHNDIFEPRRKNAVGQLIVGIVFPSVVIAIVLFVAGMAILTKN